MFLGLFFPSADPVLRCLYSFVPVSLLCHETYKETHLSLSALDQQCLWLFDLICFLLLMFVCFLFTGHAFTLLHYCIVRTRSRRCSTIASVTQTFQTPRQINRVPRIVSSGSRIPRILISLSPSRDAISSTKSLDASIRTRTDPAMDIKINADSPKIVDACTVWLQSG
jgi:hypothetical protein